MVGSEISDSYKNREVTFAKPTTKSEMEHYVYIGKITYIGRYVYHVSTLKYWSNQMIKNQSDK